LKNLWNIEEVWAKLAIWRPLMVFYTKWDYDSRLEKQVDTVLEFLCPGLVPSHLKTTSWDGCDKWSEMEFLLQSLYTLVWTNVKLRMDSASKGFGLWNRQSIDLPLADLVEFQQDKEAMEQFLCIVERAKEKQLNSSVSSKKVKESPLAIIKWLMKAKGGRRPLWTNFKKEDLK
jgi:hypothetical protein